MLDNVIGAFAEYTCRVRPGADLREILPHARHNDPAIRARVAYELIAATGSRKYPTSPAPAHPPAP